MFAADVMIRRLQSWRKGSFLHEQTSLPARTIAHDDELATDLSHPARRHEGPSQHEVHSKWTAGFARDALQDARHRPSGQCSNDETQVQRCKGRPGKCRDRERTLQIGRQAYKALRGEGQGLCVNDPPQRLVRRPPSKEFERRRMDSGGQRSGENAMLEVRDQSVRREGMVGWGLWMMGKVGMDGRRLCEY